MGRAGKVVLVTGGVGGIAMATNEALLARGARVAIPYPAADATKVAQAPRDLGPERAAAFLCDVTDGTRVEDAVTAAIGHFGDAHRLVNTVDCITLAPAETVTARDRRRNGPGTRSMSTPCPPPSCGPIVLLLSNGSDMITGENLVIDGGFTL